MENISCTVWKYLTSVTVGNTVALRTALLIDRRHQTAKREQLYLFRPHEQDLNCLLRLRALPKYYCVRFCIPLEKRTQNPRGRIHITYRQ